MPKQFLSLTDDGKTMIQLTVERIRPLVELEDIYIATNKDYKPLVLEQLPGIPEENILCEPIGRNTAPCIGLGAIHIAKKYEDALMMVLPSDHLIKYNTMFVNTLSEGCAVAEKGANLVTIGITPDYPETGYGYIKFNSDKTDGQAYEVERFVEKPSLYRAIQTISPNAYFSHYSAVEYHNLTNNIPKTIFISLEKSKPLKELPKKQLIQEEINRAFYMPPRISKNLTIKDIYSINLLQSKYSNKLGIIETNYNNAKINITNIERTLIDITVSPYYCGGCFEVLNVYKKARGRVNIQKLYDMLIKLDYIYPHHQVIGFYLEKAGFKEADLQLFDHNKELRFFVQRELKEKERKYSERWNLYYPEFL